ncbi:uncharacterized protein Z519_00687 [Cladophialophora bantiana CBS 173.52]|uniref:GED domain-containing protein n=1 Tax=Cladophialophora bantiana (strain ATCC 10958 / CBS 173.52 / CDC B-1940 / NIH 8579) TaxID=1442370 RepID=A0A0D2IQP9_CLAB1|nr:uncharacterized protein Z519_00687 [Cladophialophora bantiana CBS 173.52]KIW99024.1 hypothetical protein Z519_00687 [Cladophialophora bantiana CBS 173.52]
MGDDPFQNPGKPLAPLIQLQSKDHEEILNVIDQFRSEGISKYVNLPQLIVCGDQSSGKSSVLEAISGLSFPVKDNVCTRFATELILRRSPKVGIKASIHADEARPSAEQDRIRGFRSSTIELNDFASIVREAERYIGVGQEGHLFSKDVLRVEVSGPTQPHLTLVDLPGLYHAPDEFQSAEGVDFVESLVLSYIRNKRSVILAVISAKSDIALQKVTAFTRKVDRVGNRTMGIITKPDTLPENSEMERSFYDLAMNTRLTFRLGWHVLKNREHKEQHYSLQQRHESEANFLAQGIWAAMPRALVGIDSLRPRLSTVLKDHIISQLPGLIAEAQRSCKVAESALQKLGKARQTLADQRRYLLDASDCFTTLVGHAINGIYTSPFFGDAMEDEGYERRLRAVVQNRLTDLAQTMEERGMQRVIIDDDDEMDPEENQILRSDFVDEVKQRMRRSRGRELPGTFNPLIIGDLFYLQSRPWESIVADCIDNLLGDVRKAIIPMLQDILDEKSFRGLLEHVINSGIEKIEETLRVKTTELLKPQQSRHAITYNHYFTESVQKAREERLCKYLRANLKEFFGSEYPLCESVKQKQTFRMDELIAALGTQTEANMERFAASEAIDCMLAYYKASPLVARKKFVDDFSILAVENCLLDSLAVIFCPGSVALLSDETIKAIAEEDEGSRIERKRLEQRVKTLNSGLRRLHRFDRHNLSVQRSSDEESRRDSESVLEAFANDEPASEINGNDLIEDDGRKDSRSSASLARSPVSLNDDITMSPAGEEVTVPELDSLVGFEGKARPRKKRHSKASMWEGGT